jgi:hypothetical protein
MHIRAISYSGGDRDSIIAVIQIERRFFKMDDTLDYVTLEELKREKTLTRRIKILILVLGYGLAVFAFVAGIVVWTKDSNNMFVLLMGTMLVLFGFFFLIFMRYYQITNTVEITKELVILEKDPTVLVKANNGAVKVDAEGLAVLTKKRFWYTFDLDDPWILVENKSESKSGLIVRFESNRFFWLRAEDEIMIYHNSAENLIFSAKTKTIIDEGPDE